MSEWFKFMSMRFYFMLKLFCRSLLLRVLMQETGTDNMGVSMLVYLPSAGGYSPAEGSNGSR